MKAKDEKTTVALVPGKVAADHLTGLLALTGIRSSALKQALRDHLVEGVPTATAWREHGVSGSQGHRRLDVVQEAHRKVAAIAEFYQP